MKVPHGRHIFKIEEYQSKYSRESNQGAVTVKM
jgi:hypothetical protein